MVQKNSIPGESDQWPEKGFEVISGGWEKNHWSAGSVDTLYEDDKKHTPNRTKPRTKERETFIPSIQNCSNHWFLSTRNDEKLWRRGMAVLANEHILCDQ
jgi:hypothetical protein